MKKVKDYRKYVLSLREYIVYGIIFTVGMIVAVELFFEVLWPGFVLSAIFLPLFYRKISGYLKNKRISALEEEFCLYMQLVAASLSGGISFSNVFREVADNISSEDKSLMKSEFYTIDRMIKLRYDSREAFLSFAERSGSKDIESMAQALLCTSFAGGNVVNLIRSGVSALRLKQDTEREIRRIVSLPKMNHRIMTAMPFAFVILLKSMAPEYMKCLYIWPGRIVMIVVSVILVLAWLLGEKMGRVNL